jgi:hypothetical protein
LTGDALNLRDSPNSNLLLSLIGVPKHTDLRLANPVAAVSKVPIQFISSLMGGAG